MWVLWLYHMIALALCERVHLALETMSLRPQLAVLARSAIRPQCSPVDRRVWVLLSTVWSRGRKRPGRPAIAAEMRALIRQMSQENVLFMRSRHLMPSGAG